MGKDGGYRKLGRGDRGIGVIALLNLTAEGTSSLHNELMQETKERGTSGCG